MNKVNVKIVRSYIAEVSVDVEITKSEYLLLNKFLDHKEDFDEKLIINSITYDDDYDFADCCLYMLEEEEINDQIEFTKRVRKTEIKT